MHYFQIEFEAHNRQEELLREARERRLARALKSRRCNDSVLEQLRVRRLLGLSRARPLLTPTSTLRASKSDAGSPLRPYAIARGRSLSQAGRRRCVWWLPPSAERLWAPEKGHWA